MEPIDHGHTPGARDATIEWMVGDLTQRCQEVAEVLRGQPIGPDQLSGAAARLRAVIADLTTVIEQLEPATSSDPDLADDATQVAFGLAFGVALRERRLRSRAAEP
jgi:hypothetical protein